MRATPLAAACAALLGPVLLGADPPPGHSPLAGPAGGGAAPPVEIVEPITPGAGERFVPDEDAPCGTGVLRVRPGDGGDPGLVELPLEHTSVEADVAGAVARVRVVQTFGNPSEVPIEAVYVFPLPHESAVTDLEMRIGERTIRGLVERREEARRRYEEARDAGHVAALLEEERPNIFTQSVANILPGNRVEIVITYVERLSSEDGTWEFAFPMVVGPRYHPAGEGRDAILPARHVQHGTGPERTPNPAFLPPSLRSGHDVDVTVTLDAGVPLRSLVSPTHAFERTHLDRGRARVRLHPLDTIPNRDFVLRWDVEARGPEVAVLGHREDGEGWLSVVIHPKDAPADAEITPKELYFVLDCSGSMSGEPIAAAKTLVRHALRRLGPRDTFTILRFSTSASGFVPRPVAATPDNVARGLAYLDALQGSGGTEMLQGILATLDPPRDPERLRVVMFLTDGYIGNENRILAEVRQRIGGARLFSFGVGSSVNRFLLEEMAREGRGEARIHLPGADVTEAVETFWERVRRPYLTDVELAWEGGEVRDVSPARVPDLFAGTPLVVRGRWDGNAPRALVVRGHIAGRRWERRIRLHLDDARADHPAVATLWARSRIADLERSMRAGESPTTIEEIVGLGLRHHLVTPWTSFVAVEERLVVSDGRPQTVHVPVGLPEGVSWEGVFGEPDPGLPMQLPGAASPSGNLFRRGGRASEERTSVIDSKSESGLRVVDGLPVAGGVRPRPDGSDRLGREEPSSAPVVEGGERDEATASAGLRIRLSAEPLAADADTLVLRVTFTNEGSRPVLVPADGALDASNLGLAVLDDAWRERTVGDSTRTVATGPLAPGASVVRVVRLPRALLAAAGSRVLHLRLPGDRWGTAAPATWTVRIGVR